MASQQRARAPAVSSVSREAAAEKSVKLEASLRASIDPPIRRSTGIPASSFSATAAVRSFPPEKFKSAYEEEIKQRATWYYCPQALSEYKLPFLDIAHRLGLLSALAPTSRLDGGYCTSLFGGAQPTSVGFSEQEAFRHYLHCLSQQTKEAVKPTFDDTVKAHEELLDSTHVVLKKLSATGIRGQLRDFGEILDVNRAALALHMATRGPMLRHTWDSL